jgi:HlyD family type I secretion membrane fusion protein
MTEERAKDTASAAAQNAQSFPGLWESIRTPVYLGLLIIVVFFGLFGGWAALAPLNSAALAKGVVSVESKRKTVQHLEGGIIDKILVKAGDKVKAGQILIRLDDTMAKAKLDLLQGRMNSALALEARLKTEREGKTKIDFPDSLIANKDDPRIAEVITGQKNIFDARRESMSGKKSILKLRIAQIAEEISGLKGQIRANDTQIRLIKSEIADVSGLVKKGLAPKPRLLRLERRLAEIRGGRSKYLADIARSKQTIAETTLQISELRTKMINEVTKQLQDVRNKQLDLLEKIRAAKDVLRRIDIRAPRNGTVVNLQVHTSGGVIGPGEPLLDIVPMDDQLIIEARINPKDIDVVHPGLEAQVRLTAFSRRRFPPLEGRVMTVSADTLTDKRTGISYYLARIKLAGNAARILGITNILPGMQAEVMIITGTQTLLKYLFRPVDSTINRALREN